MSKYKRDSNAILDRIISAFTNSDADDKRYVCITCHSYLVRGKLPPQAAVNGLLLENIPSVLRVTELESVLIAQRVLFMKLMALPRGRQRAIHGAVVNVPSNVSSTVTSLPLTPSKAGLLPLKLKRRLRYKGYVMHQFLRPDAVLQAVNWLVENNSLYSGIPVDRQWTQSCMDDDEETWKSVTGSADDTGDTQHADDQQSDVKSSGSDSDEDNVEDKVRGLKFNTCLQPSDPQYAATELWLAPAEGQTPLDFMLDTNAEVLAFPAKFPHGTGGLTNERDTALTPKKYFIQRLLNLTLCWRRKLSVLRPVRY